MAVPVRDHGRMLAMLIGVVIPADSLLTAIAGEQLFAVARGLRVVLPRNPPAWTQGVDFRGRLAALHNSGSEGRWTIENDEVIAE
ncbi:MAG: hypothetical protein H7Z43_04635, partial [Clostridia bacterium]|nr:hypothetical protein [Deltaproteobacteria bacterium]